MQVLEYMFSEVLYLDRSQTMVLQERFLIMNFVCVYSVALTPYWTTLGYSLDQMELLSLLVMCLILATHSLEN